MRFFNIFIPGVNIFYIHDFNSETNEQTAILASKTGFSHSNKRTGTNTNKWKSVFALVILQMYSADT